MQIRAAVSLAVVLGVGTLVPRTASAQYFGQNQVQHRSFDFQVLKTPHFDIYYYPEERAAADLVARLAERWYERFSTLFDHEMKDRQPLMLYASPADFRQTNVVSGLGEGTGGVTESFKRRVVMPSAGALAETNHVLGHELIHAFQYDINSRGGGARPPGTEPGHGGQPGRGDKPEEGDTPGEDEEPEGGKEPGEGETPQGRAKPQEGGQPRGSGGEKGQFARLPLWFVEGMAEYFSLGPVDSQTAMWLRDAVASEKLPTLDQLGNPRYFPYRFGHAFWAYVGGRWGDERAVALFRQAIRLGDTTAAIKAVLGQDEKTFSEEWGESVERTYTGFLDANKTPADYGPLLIGKKRGGGELNLGPALSPDGKRVVFLSERDLFSIDLFLADADTGKVIRKLTSTATDPHFDSLEFIESAGAWSADGRRFVQSAVRKGRGAFFVIDPDTGHRLQEIALKDIGSVTNPVFTPDGDRVIFSALQGGLLDLWEYDLRNGERRRLTDDVFAELQPAVSPDGTHVAFTTDRFTTRLDTLDFGEYRVGILDLSSGDVRELPGYPGARNSNPQWSPDGKTIYFLSDALGGTDIHRVDLATGELRVVTRLSTGVYGVTALSPSLSVAQTSGRIAYTAREKSEHNIYAIDDPVIQAGTVAPAELADVREARHIVPLPAAPTAVAAGKQPKDKGGASKTGEQPKPSLGEPTAVAVPQTVRLPADVGTVSMPGQAYAVPPTPPVPLTEAVGPAQGSTAVLPPFTRVASRVESMLDDPQTGLPSPSSPEPQSEPYQPKLELLAVGQPSIGVGFNRFGTYAGGSAALYFSDMLGNRNLSLAFQAYGELSDVGGQAVYSNLTHRVDWAVGAQYVPYLYSGGVTRTYYPSRGAFVDEYVLERQRDAAIFGVAAYPLSRADRFEVQGTLRHHSFSAELRSETYDYYTGQFLGDEKLSLDTGYDPLYLGGVSGAFVHDTSIFGATSPILGQRYRVEVAPSFGSVNYTDVLADWRAYFMPVRPVTLAVRGMHFGRYGSGSNDRRFGSLYLGYPELLRGYDNIEASECRPDEHSDCPLYERLFGSRFLVANVELRAPLYGLFRGRLAYGPLPIEIALFADAGVAWSGGCGAEVGDSGVSCPFADPKPKLFGGDQDLLTSVGAAVRVNVVGIAVVEFSWARPLQREDENGKRMWVWQWSISPGF